jgi:hypothetical protein
MIEPLTQRNTKRFQVALSFAGENRNFVESVAEYLSRNLGQNRVFYDRYYEAELARPNLDTYLMNIYREGTDLIAIFLCSNYAQKEWCGLEWRVVRDILKSRHDWEIMSFKFDDVRIEGLLSIDGYIDIDNRTPEEVAYLILQRIEGKDTLPLPSSRNPLSTVTKAKTPPPQTPSGIRTGSIKAGGKMQADNAVTGIQIQGGDVAIARACLDAAQALQQTGSIEAVQDLIAKNVVTGLQYIGQAGTTPDVEQFQRELAALREQLQQAIQAREIANPYDAEDAQKAVDRAIEQTRTDKPVAERISTQLDKASTIITKAATVAAAAGKFQAVVIKLAPVVTALQKLASLLFG